MSQDISVIVEALSNGDPLRPDVFPTLPSLLDEQLQVIKKTNPEQYLKLVKDLTRYFVALEQTLVRD